MVRLQRLGFTGAGKFTEQPEAGVVHVAYHNRAAGDTDDNAAICAPL